ncbi:response regulator [Streptomyces phaeochromogenes]|uniref:response regulator n=1 Tax=Streptomyces phaeochromogenes TaxID=1923 RepID=UPI00372299E5
MLVEDDDAGVRQALDLGLGLEGFPVRLAEGGETALEQVADRLPSVIVLDVTMPGLSGAEMVHRLRAMGRTCECLLPVFAYHTAAGEPLWHASSRGNDREGVPWRRA